MEHTENPPYRFWHQGIVNNNIDSSVNMEAVSRTLPRLVLIKARADGYVPTRLMYRLICNLPELSIRIFNPLTSYFLIYRCVFRIADPYIFCCRIANPTEH